MLCVRVRGREGYANAKGWKGLQRGRRPALVGALGSPAASCPCPSAHSCRGFDWDALAQRSMKPPYVPKV